MCRWELLSVVPSPSWPWEFSPQQWTAPLDSRTQVWRRPAQSSAAAAGGCGLPVGLAGTAGTEAGGCFTLTLDFSGGVAGVDGVGFDLQPAASEMLTTITSKRLMWSFPG